MKKQNYRNWEKLSRQRAILVALSDDLMQPLLHVKTSLELMEADDFSKPTARTHARSMGLSAAAGLHLIEAYHLLLKSEDVFDLPVEAVSIGTILDEVAQQITPYAEQFSTDLIIDVQGRFAPILTHQPSLATVLEVLATSMIAAQAAQSQQKNYQLVLGAHRAPEGGVAVGAFSSIDGLSDSSLKAARNLVGRARQPLPSVPRGTASGILIADMLCSTLWQPLHASAHRSLNGLATNLPLSSQLQIV